MDEIQITDLSSRVLNAMRARNLKAKPITEFERYGLRRILLHFSEHEWIAYSKEAVWAFVLQERLRVESGQLPAYQWAHARRAAVYLEQMAEHGVIQESPLPRWEAEHNRLFRSVAQDEPPSQKIEILICQVRDAIMKLDMSEKAKRNYCCASWRIQNDPAAFQSSWWCSSAFLLHNQRSRPYRKTDCSCPSLSCGDAAGEFPAPCQRPPAQ